MLDCLFVAVFVVVLFALGRYAKRLGIFGSSKPKIAAQRALLRCVCARPDAPGQALVTVINYDSAESPFGEHRTVAVPSDQVERRSNETYVWVAVIDRCQVPGRAPLVLVELPLSLTVGLRRILVQEDDLDQMSLFFATELR